MTTQQQPSFYTTQRLTEFSSVPVTWGYFLMTNHNGLLWVPNSGTTLPATTMFQPTETWPHHCPRAEGAERACSSLTHSRPFYAGCLTVIAFFESQVGNSNLVILRENIHILCISFPKNNPGLGYFPRCPSLGWTTTGQPEWSTFTVSFECCLVRHCKRGPMVHHCPCDRSGCGEQAGWK